MEKLPFISVIIPTFQEEKYIENCLKSVKNQDYKGRYEIIVVDSYSKDKTVKIARKYTDKVIRIKKRGVGTGRNEGARAAKGEILLFIDADTILLFNGLSEISKAFRKGNVVGATCPIIPLSAKVRDFIIYWMYDQFVKASVERKKPHIAGIVCAYRKKAFEKIGGFNERLKFCEDIDLSKRISELGKVVVVEKALALTSPRRFERWGRTKGARKYITFYVNYLLGKVISARKFRPIR